MIKNIKFKNIGDKAISAGEYSDLTIEGLIGENSFIGIANKDGGIAPFETAEKAYQEVPFTGFRTFLKGERAGSKDCWNHISLQEKYCYN